MLILKFATYRFQACMISARMEAIIGDKLYFSDSFLSMISAILFAQALRLMISL